MPLKRTPPKQPIATSPLLGEEMDSELQHCSSEPILNIERISDEPCASNYLAEEARQMFYHAYNAYMDNAYPAVELMPLSCKGRWKGVTWQVSKIKIDFLISVVVTAENYLQGSILTRVGYVIRLRKQAIVQGNHD
ncbi:hypothetical protein K1T71_005879 [Dendrolimus kikuchii]|uniref:Uncharacterized protein n=1 Tax=Dendrolimus kikuchii TaxID=765133 RepID=A0ACC1D2K9_9NEOP|nr:hypothetical protein K1T71_005879 [Dendrolimus kikuchii]